MNGNDDKKLDEWYKSQCVRFHSGQLDERQIAYAAWTAAMQSLVPAAQNEIRSFLLVNALRNLSQEQQAGLCVDLYARNENKNNIDETIAALKLQ